MSRKPSTVIVVEKELLRSRAYCSIKYVNSFRILFEFFCRRQFAKPTGRRDKHSKPIMVNNGELVLTYKQVMDMFSCSQTTVSRCFTELVELGFLNVEMPSCGLHRQPTKWRLSDRWKRYGEPDFECVERNAITPPFASKK